MAAVRRTSIALVTLLLLGTACDEERGPRQERAGAFQWRGVAGPGDTLRVREMLGEITVTPSADDTLRVTADIAWRRGDPDESLHFSGSREGRDVLICAIWGEGTCSVKDYDTKMRNGRGTDARVHFRIEAPAGVALDLIGISADISAAASAPVTAKTLDGDIVIVTAVGPARGETMNGSVDLRMASLANADSIVAKSMNGDVFVFLPALADATVELSTANGSVSTEFPVTVTGEPSRRGLKAVLGSGRQAIYLRTLNGTASLRRLDAEGRSGGTP